MRGPTWRESANRTAAASTPDAANAGERSMSSGASTGDRSSAKCARSSMTPRNTHLAAGEPLLAHTKNLGNALRGVRTAASRKVAEIVTDTYRHRYMERRAQH